MTITSNESGKVSEPNGTLQSINRRGFLASAGALSSYSLAGCIGGNGVDDDVLKIGFTRATDGFAVHDSEMAYKSMQLWLNEVEAEGGLLVGDERKEIELIIYDNQSSIERTTRLYDELISEDNVDVLLGPFSSTLTINAAAVAARENTFMISWGAASPAIYAQGYDNIVGVEETVRGRGVHQVGAIDELSNVDSIALAYQDLEFPTSIADTIEEGADTLNIDLVYHESFPPDIRDYSTMIAEVEDLNPDVFWIETASSDPIVTIIRQMQEIDANFDWIQTSWSTNPELLDALGANATYMGGLHKIHPNLDREVTAGLSIPEFFSEYRELYDGEAPSFNGANGYAGILILGEILKEAEVTRDVDELFDAAQRLSGETVTVIGDFEIEDTGENIARNYVITQNLSDMGDIYDRFHIVHPGSATGDAVVPIPTWDER